MGRLLPWQASELLGLLGSALSAFGDKTMTVPIVTAAANAIQLIAAVPSASSNQTALYEALVMLNRCVVVPSRLDRGLPRHASEGVVWRRYMDRLVDASTGQPSVYETAQLGSSVVAVLDGMLRDGLMTMSRCASKRPAEEYDTALQVGRRHRGGQPLACHSPAGTAIGGRP